MGFILFDCFYVHTQNSGQVFVLISSAFILFYDLDQTGVLILYFTSPKQKLILTFTNVRNILHENEAKLSLYLDETERIKNQRVFLLRYILTYILLDYG